MTVTEGHEGVNLAYKRVWPSGPPEEEQDALLKGIGFKSLDPDMRDVYRDGPTTRKRTQQDDQLPGLTDAIRAIHPGEGDVLWIAFPEVLGHTDREAMRRLAEIARLGGLLGVASMGRTFKWHPDAADALDFLAARGGYADRLRTAPARAAVAKKRKEQDAEFQRELRRVAKLWKDLDVPVTRIEKMTGRGRSTLYRWQREGRLPMTRRLSR